MKFYAVVLVLGWLWNAGDPPKNMDYSILTGGWRFLTLKTEYFRSILGICPAEGMWPVVVRYGEPKDHDSCPSGPVCMQAICTWYAQNGHKMYMDTYRPKPYFSIHLSGDDYASVPINGPCHAHDMCVVCGQNGRCVAENSEPKCKCKEGYTGDYCQEEAVGNNNVIIAVTILGAVLAVFIIIAIIAHLCWKNKSKESKVNVVTVPTVPHKHHGPPGIQLVNTGNGHCGQHVCQPPSLPPPCGCRPGPVHCGPSIPSVPSCHHHPQSSVRISEIRDDGVYGLNTYVGGHGHGYNPVDNATRYTTQSHGPTVITNMPNTVGTTFGGHNSVALL